MRDVRHGKLCIVWFHVNGFLEKAQVQAQKYICGCQCIGVEEGVWWRIAQGSIFEPVEHFLYFYCGSIYTMVCICQNSTNGNALKHWLLSYINYISTLLTFFFKGKGTFTYLNIGYHIHLDHELINIKILFGIFPRPGQLPGFPIPPLYSRDRTQKLDFNHVYNSLSFSSSPYSCWVLPILLWKYLIRLRFPMSTASAVVRSLPPFNCQPPSNGLSHPLRVSVSHPPPSPSLSYSCETVYDFLDKGYCPTQELEGMV